MNTEGFGLACEGGAGEGRLVIGRDARRDVPEAHRVPLGGWGVCERRLQ